MSPSDADDRSVEEILDSLLELRRRGEPLPLEKLYIDRPDIAKALQRLLPAADMLDGVHVGPLRVTSDLPEQFGNYRLIREIGRGGMGVVFEGRHEETSRRVAIKVLGSDLLANRGARLRFEREAGIAARFDHPGICPVLESGEIDGVPYLAMPFVEGATLANSLRERNSLRGVDSTEVDASLRRMEEICRTVHEAHQMGVIHRDLKPGNIIIGADDRAIVLDFGLARDLRSDDPTLTRTGDTPGTPSYMSPEQIDPTFGPIDERADVHALGVMLYEMLTGRLPYRAATRDLLFRAIVDDAPPDPRRSNPLLTSAHRAIVDTALAKQPRHRYQTALDFAEDLRRVRDGDTVLARTVSQLTRAWRWASRHPVAATLVVTLAVSLPVITSLSTYVVLTQSERAEGERRARERDAIEILQQSFGHPGERSTVEKEALRREALALDPTNSLARAGLASLLLETDRPVEALALLEEPTSDATTHQSLSRLLVLARRALDLEVAPAQEAAAAGGARTPTDWFLAGDEEIKRGLAGEDEAYLRAYDDFTQAALRERRPILLHAIGRVWAAGLLRDVDKLERAASALLFFDPESGTAHYWIGRAWRSCGDFERSLVALTRSAALLPDVPRIRCYLSEALADVGRVTEAIEQGEAAIRLAPRFHLAYGAFGAALERGGELARAAEAFHRAGDLSPDNRSHPVREATVLLQIGKTNNAHAALDRALTAHPDNGGAMECRGIVLAAEGRFAEAEQQFETLGLQRPLSARIQALLGQVRAAQGNLHGALQAYDKSLELSPDQGAFHYGKGVVLFQARRLEEADRALREALRLSPGDMDVVEMLVQVRQAQGDLKGRDRILAAVEAALDAAKVEPEGMRARLEAIQRSLVVPSE